MSWTRLHSRGSHPKHRASDEVTRLRASLADADRLILTQAERLAGAQATAAQEVERARIDRAHLAQAERQIRDRDRTIAELQRRLDVGVRAETVVARTQPMPTLDARFDSGPVRRLGAVDALKGAS